MKFNKHFEIIELRADGIIGIRPHLFGADIFQDRFSLFGIVPEVSLLCNTFFVFDFYSLAIVVKDTSSRQPLGPSNLSIGLLS